MWRKEVRGSNNCLSGLTRLELNHRKNCWKSQISFFLSETEKYPLPASSSGQHCGPSRAAENLILLIAAVDFLRNFSTILCTGLIFQPLRESPLSLGPGGSREDNGWRGFLITNLYIPYSILIWEQLNGPHYSKLKGEGSHFLEQFPHYCWWKCRGPSLGFIDNWLMGLVAIIVSIMSGRIQSRMGNPALL